MIRGALLLLVGRVVSALTTLVVLAAVGRLRSSEEFGAVAVGFAIGIIVAVVSDAGHGSLLIREVSREPRRATVALSATLAVRLVTVPVALAISALVASLAFPAHAAIITLVAWGLVAQMTAELFRSLFTAHGRLLVSSVHMTVENLLWLAAVALVLAVGGPTVAAFAAGSAVLVASAVAGAVAARAALRVRVVRPGLDAVRGILARGAPFTAFAVIGTAALRVDTVLVGAILPAGLAAAGAYFAAVRIVNAFEYFSESVTRATFPELARAHDSPARTAELLRRGTRLLLLVGIPIPFLLLVAGPWLMTTLFGDGVGANAWLVVLVGPLVPMRFLAQLLGITLTSRGEQGRRVVAATGGLVATVALDLALLPRLGPAAAAIGALGSAAWILGVYLWSLRPEVRATGVAGWALAVLLVASAATLLGILVRPLTTPPVAALVTAVAYAAGTALLPEGPRSVLRRAMRRRAVASSDHRRPPPPDDPDAALSGGDGGSRT